MWALTASPMRRSRPFYAILPCFCQKKKISPTLRDEPLRGARAPRRRARSRERKVRALTPLPCVQYSDKYSVRCTHRHVRGRPNTAPGRRVRVQACHPAQRLGVRLLAAPLPSVDALTPHDKANKFPRTAFSPTRNGAHSACNSPAAGSTLRATARSRIFCERIFLECKR